MSENTSDREIFLTRILNAPRELVFKVWTDPNHVAKWWGPNGFTNTIHEMEVKPGGVWKLTMHGPDGVDYPNKIVFTKVERPKLLMYNHGSDDVSHPGDFAVTVTFDEQDGKTKLTMRMVFRSKEELDKVVEKYGALEGAHQHVARLEAYLHRFNENS